MEEIFVLYILAELLGGIAAIVYVCQGKPAIPKDRLFIAPMAAAAAVQGLVGIGQIAVGIAQKAKAAKIARANKRPVLEDNPYTQDAYDIAASDAQQGLSEEALQTYRTQNDRSLASSINAILKSGGSANIADLYDGNQQGIRQMAFADNEARVRNVDRFLKANDAKANEVRDQWYLNEYVPYQDKAALSAGLSSQGMDNIWKGIGTAGGGAMNMIGSGKIGGNATTAVPPQVLTDAMRTPIGSGANMPRSSYAPTTDNYVPRVSPTGYGGMQQGNLGLLPGMGRPSSQPIWNPFTQQWQ